MSINFAEAKGVSYRLLLYLFVLLLFGILTVGLNPKKLNCLICACYRNTVEFMCVCVTVIHLSVTNFEKM